MANIKKIICLLIMLIFCGAFMCGCNFDLGIEKRTVNGCVTFDDIGLEGVKITDRVDTYAITDANGNFSFQTSKNSLTIYPQKTGYIFTPAKVTITDQESVNFTCEKAQNLNGKLVLSQVLITPISIVSFSENNFMYKNEDVSCLKIHDVNIVINDNLILNNTFDNFADLGKQTNILGENSFEYAVIDGNTDIKIDYTLSAYFTIYKHESTAIETEKILRVNKVLDTGSLIDNKYELFVNNVNSVHNGYSYNINFVFDYIANEGV